jgi:hypothetical protein
MRRQRVELAPDDAVSDVRGDLVVVGRRQLVEVGLRAQPADHVPDGRP